jgi:GntR family transcriptional regulator, transcriptional repressor for pyruvate dehydrogenase complex
MGAEPAMTGIVRRRVRKIPALTDIEPIRRETVMDTVALRIKSLLQSGQLKSGDRLPPEPELAKMLRVSRSSLREALKGLMFLGLLKARPGDGTYIQSSLDRVLNQHFQWMILLREVEHMEVYELRKIIEPKAASLAAQRATRSDLDRIAKAVAAMRADQDDRNLFHLHDIEFHEAFMGASGNVALQTTMRMLYHATAEARMRVLPLIENMDAHWKRHDRVYRAIRDRNSEQASKAVLDDLLYAEKLLRRSLEREGKNAIDNKPKESAKAAVQAGPGFRRQRAITSE